jgi:peptidoglycan-associated lipoprotein
MIKIQKQILLIVILLISLISFSQEFTPSKHTIKANEIFRTNDLVKSIELYTKAYKKAASKPEKAYCYFQIAECYRLMGNTRKAVSKYKSAISKKYSNPIIYLYYADMLKANQKFDEAKAQYIIYKEKVPDDERGGMGMESCDKIGEWMKVPTRYIIRNMKQISSKYSEFAAAYSNESYSEVYFTTTKPKDNYTKISPVTGDYFSDIYVSEQDKKGAWSDAVYLDDTICSPFDDGTPTFAADFRTLYFTRCKVVKGMRLGCQIYKSKMNAEGMYDVVEALPIVHDSISIGHPSISADELTLFFTADMFGGKGGKDIWKVERTSKSGDWGKPINLGDQINTKGNEMYAYIREDGRLYFSSDYLPGIGGLDLFVATPKGENLWEVQNMRYPMNSAQDDFGIVFKGNTEEGMFSSTRKKVVVLVQNSEDASVEEEELKSRGKEDVFHFILPPLEYDISANIIDANTIDPLDSASVQIIGSDGTDIILQVDEEGFFKYTLKQNTDYIYIVRRKNYLYGKGEATTKNLANSKHFKKDIVLAQIGEPIQIDNVFYDFGKWDLREESKVNLNQLIDILNDNPTITIELSSHTDMIGDEVSNEILSQKRAESVVKYLIEKGINPERLVAKGYGESVPKIINKKLAKTTPFKVFQILNEEFINLLKENAKTEEEGQKLYDNANQVNRRTEFKVLSTTYIPDI